MPNYFSEKARVKDPASDSYSPQKHHVIVTDGCAAYLDHGWLRFHALYLCLPCP